MWRLGTLFSDGLGSVTLVVRLDDLKGPFQHRQFYDSMNTNHTSSPGNGGGKGKDAVSKGDSQLFSWGEHHHSELLPGTGSQRNGRRDGGHQLIMWLNICREEKRLQVPCKPHP